ncbi:MAG: M20/M25/M40 family metallo-hydrolase [Gammaproteobacteria bacterium]
MIRTRNILLAGCALAVAACSTTPEDHHERFQAVSHPPVMLSHLHALARSNNDLRRNSLVAMLKTHGLEPELTEFPNSFPDRGDPRGSGTNISFTVGEGEKEIIVGAHYDAARLADGSISEGMVDNGASVIALIHVADELRQHRETNHKVRFVFFDMEEIGLVGSRHFAQSLDPEKVVAMINLDVNAYGETVFYGATQHGHAPLYDAMRAACRDLERECVDFPDYPPSDYLSFEEVAIPNVSLSVLPRSEAYELWLAMNAGATTRFADDFVPGVFRRIHSDGDTFETVQPAAIVAVCDVVLGLLHHLNHVEFPPREPDPEIPMREPVP